MCFMRDIVSVAGAISDIRCTTNERGCTFFLIDNGL